MIANGGGPFPAESSEGIRLNLAVADVEGAVWTWWDGLDIERRY